jgi:hypothetical protein
MSAKCQERTLACLFDHLVSAGDEGRRDVQADSGGGLQIDYQLELGR